ncbi:hypothetical protein ACF1AB_28325 [Streptomyces sp. NPDC014846]|uniref:hypothetical protein n=1 Tax=Streptomyces sp. NPDC014846 TaxID=3364922 RepID=UPI0036F4EC46
MQTHDSAAYRCDNYYGTSGCAIPEAPTGVSMINQPRIADGVRVLRQQPALVNAAGVSGLVKCNY